MKTYDVIICGAGTTGVAAAIAAGRAGADVLLIERYGFGGGMATSALVNPFAGHEYHHPQTKQLGSLIAGLFKEIVCRLHEKGGYGAPWTPSCFDEERLKYIYDVLLRESGVDILYHTFITDVVREGDQIKALKTITKGGAGEVRGKVVIDSTGDGDVAALAGCEWSLGRESDQLTQAMTVKFRVGGVDKEAMQRDLLAQNNPHNPLVHPHKAARLLVEPYFQKALAEGRLHFPFREWIHFYDYPHAGVLHFNMTRITKVSGLSANDLTHAEIEGRRQAFLLTDWLVQEVPYFQHAYLEKVACQVGVRETRHIKGHYTMSGEDITSARKFPDAIVRSAYSMDIHSPDGSGFDHEIKGAYGAFKQEYSVPEGDYYEVPYRSIVPQGIDNLLVACRAFSGTHEASAAVRVMATLTGMGEAAGIAAAHAAKSGIRPQDVDGSWLRKQLRYLDEPPEFGVPWSSEQG